SYTTHAPLFFFVILPRPPTSTLFPYTTLFRSLPFWVVTVNAALTPLNFNTVRPLLRLAPEIPTAAPGLPTTGMKRSMSGARVTTKFSALEPDPDALVTVIGPLLVAAAGTMAKSWLAVRGL